MNLIDLFNNSIKNFESRTAFIMRERFRLLKWSYGDLEKHTHKILQFIKQKKIKKGERIVLLSQNSPYWVAAYFAILAQGATVIPLNPRSTKKQIDRILKKSKPKLILKSVYIPMTDSKIPTLNIESLASGNPSATKFDINPNIVNDNSIAQIVYTSGTTGDPKGVVLTHKNIISNLEALNRSIPLPSGHVLNILPLFHMYGQMISILFPMAHGVSASFVSIPSSKEIQIALQDTPTSHLIVVPEFLKMSMDSIDHKLKTAHLYTFYNSKLFHYLPRFIRRSLSYPIRKSLSLGLHTIACGGAPLTPTVEKKWRAFGFHVLQGYGLTETSPILTINNYRNHRLGSVGKPLDNVNIKISKNGEILAKGPNVMSGYYQDSKRTKQAFMNGWFKTDDQGEIDPDGFIYVSGRKKYMIVTSSGENVFPEDIETILNKNPHLKDSTVLGIEKYGKISIHAVLLCDNCDAKTIIELANKELAPHQQINDWSIWTEHDFPRSATRKIQKEKVLSWIEQQKKPTIQKTEHEVTELTRLLSQITSSPIQKISPSSKLVRDLNLTSLLRIELVSKIEERFNSVIEEKNINNHITVKDLETLIRKNKGKSKKRNTQLHWSSKKTIRSFGSYLQEFFRRFIIDPFVKIEIEGIEQLPEQPILLMPNHKSYIDPVLILAALPWKHRKKVAIAAAKDVLYKQYSIVAPLVDLCFHSFRFPRKENENIIEGLNYSGRIIDQGYSVMVFPEGKMNLTKNKILPLKKGAGLMAIEMRIPTIPVSIVNSEKILNPGKLWPLKKGIVKIRFGKPLTFDRNENYIKATKKIQQELQKLLDES